MAVMQLPGMRTASDVVWMSMPLARGPAKGEGGRGGRGRGRGTGNCCLQHAGAPRLCNDDSTAAAVDITQSGNDEEIR